MHAAHSFLALLGLTVIKLYKLKQQQANEKLTYVWTKRNVEKREKRIYEWTTAQCQPNSQYSSNNEKKYTPIFLPFMVENL